MVPRTVCMGQHLHAKWLDGEISSIARTFDADRLKALCVDPAIFSHINDDFYLSPDDWEPSVHKFVVNLIARDSEGDFGFGIFIPDTHTCYKAHMGFLPRSYGLKALESFKAMLNWMWERTTAARIVGEVCRENRRAIQFAIRAGFKPYGINEKSRLRGGILRDQVCLGISKP